MKTLYSIVYTQLSPVSHERLNLGLIMLSEQGIKFRFADEKVNLLKRLLSTDAQKLVKSYLLSIQNKASVKNELYEPYKEISESFLNYLSDYSNNLVSFSKPEMIQAAFSDEVFLKLYNKFIFREKEKVAVPLKQGFDDSFKLSFFKRVEKRANVSIELNADKLDFVLFPITVDMIGRNDRPVLSQFIDFEANLAALRSQISNYTNLIKPFELAEKKEGKFFIVADEPSKNAGSQHLVWEHLQDSPLIREIITIVPRDEVEQIEKYLEEHDVRPYFN